MIAIFLVASQSHPLMEFPWGTLFTVFTAPLLFVLWKNEQVLTYFQALSLRTALFERIIIRYIPGVDSACVSLLVGVMFERGYIRQRGMTG